MVPVSRSFLQRQSDKITKAASGQSILVRKHAIIRGQPNFGAHFHGFGQQVCGKTPCQRSRKRFLKEKPEMCAIARARTFQCDRQIEFPGHINQRLRIMAPAFTVKDHHGNDCCLGDFAGKTVVLWFYPKADTPG